MKVNRYVLKNGVRVVIVEIPDKDIVVTTVVVGAGGRNEPLDKFGISHFLEHMSFKGTELYPEVEGFNKVIESVGGKQNAWTSEDHTAYYNMVPKKYLNLSLNVLKEQIAAMTLNPKEINKERNVIIEEINRENDIPEYLIGKKLHETLWHGQQMSSDILGPKENILKFKKNDFRQYMDKLYTGENISICIAGGIDENEAIKEIDNIFSAIKKGKKNLPKKVDDTQLMSNTAIFNKKIDQAHIMLAYRAFPINDERRYALDVLKTFLTGGMSSKLNHEIREKRGLAYAIYGITNYFSDTGYFAIYAGLNKEKVFDSIKIIRAKIYETKEKVLSDNDFKRAKEYLKSGILMNLDSTESISNWYGTKEILGPDTPDPSDRIRLIDRVTKDDIISVANDVFQSSGENLVVLGPFKNAEKFAKILT